MSDPITWMLAQLNVKLPSKAEVMNRPLHTTGIGRGRRGSREAEKMVIDTRLTVIALFPTWLPTRLRWSSTMTLRVHPLMRACRKDPCRATSRSAMQPCRLWRLLRFTV